MNNMKWNRIYILIIVIDILIMIIICHHINNKRVIRG